MRSVTGRYYGWQHDVRDPRDEAYRLPAPASTAGLPTSVDLWPNLPPILDQGPLGSCVWNELRRGFDYCRTMQGLPPVGLSRLMGYYQTRQLEGTLAEDCGCQIRDALKVLNRWGACPEALWPYDVARFAERPPAAAYAANANDRLISYHPVEPTRAAITAALAEGDPVIFGITVHASFEGDLPARTGVVPLPDANDPVVGAHCLLFTGYTPVTPIADNSWGEGWGAGGRCFLPWPYVEREASSLWRLRLVSP